MPHTFVFTDCSSYNNYDFILLCMQQSSTLSIRNIIYYVHYVSLCWNADVVYSIKTLAYRLG